MSTISRTRVNLGGLMKVLGDNLYSTPNVALRELVQNAHDSCHRRRLESGEPFEPLIEVRGGDRCLIIEDNGAGLTRDEIDEYLATVGSGYTRGLRDRGADGGAGLIGYFGLGFLSAFVVSDRTEVHTASYQTPEAAWLFSTRKGESYTVTEAPPRPVGTTVKLMLSEGFGELADTAALQQLLDRYCCLLSFPIRCGGRVINDRPPPWRDPEISSPLRRTRVSREFAARFEPRFEPLVAIDLPGGADPPCSGLLWIQDAGSYATSDNRNVWVFVRQMMVTNEDRDLLPDWAGFVGAVIESDDLTPTASRESLKRDATYDAAAAHVRESLIRGLAEIARENPAAWRQTRLRHNEALRGAALADARLFDLLAGDVTVPTTQGELTCQAICDRAGGKIYISQSDRGGYEELLFRALKVPVVQGIRYAALPFCREYTERRGGQLVLIGTDAGDSDVFGASSCSAGEAARLAEWFAAEDTEVVASDFEPAHLPLVLMPDREVELKRRIESDEADARMSGAALGLARGFTGTIADRPGARLYVNTGCPAIRALLSAAERDRSAALVLLRSLVSMLADGAESRLMDIDEALERYCETLVEILERGRGAT